MDTAFTLSSHGSLSLWSSRIKWRETPLPQWKNKNVKKYIFLLLLQVPSVNKKQLSNVSSSPPSSTNFSFRFEGAPDLRWEGKVTTDQQNSEPSGLGHRNPWLYIGTCAPRPTGIMTFAEAKQHPTRRYSKVSVVFPRVHLFAPHSLCVNCKCNSLPIFRVHSYLFLSPPSGIHEFPFQPNIEHPISLSRPPFFSILKLLLGFWRRTHIANFLKQWNRISFFGRRPFRVQERCTFQPNIKHPLSFFRLTVFLDFESFIRIVGEDQCRLLP